MRTTLYWEFTPMMIDYYLFSYSGALSMYVARRKATGLSFVFHVLFCLCDESIKLVQPIHRNINIVDTANKTVGDH